MKVDPAAESQVVQHSDKQNRSLIIASWVLIGLVCLFALVPFFGFGSWLIAGPILFIALVMGIILLVRGRTLPGLAILLTSLIAAPVFLLVAPFVASLFGLGGTVAAVGTAGDAAPPTNTSPAGQSRPIRTSEGASPSGEFEQLKTQVQGQSEQVAALKSGQLATEGVHGYLLGDERLSIEQRHLVQQENVWRERIFDLIGQRTGHSREEIAAIFANLAQRAAANPKLTPTNQP
jgi:hypothetical protein